MNKRAFYLTAVLFGVFALILNTAGREYLVRGSLRRARRIGAAHEQDVKYTPDAEGSRLAHTGNALTATGVAFTLLGLACMVVAQVRHEPGWYLILTGLFVLDVIALMLL